MASPRIRYLAGGALALTLCLVACKGREAETEVLAPPVATARVAAVDLEERISAAGELIARRQVTIAAEVSGRVTSLLHEDDLGAWLRALPRRVLRRRPHAMAGLEERSA